MIQREKAAIREEREPKESSKNGRKADACDKIWIDIDSRR